MKALTALLIAGLVAGCAQLPARQAAPPVTVAEPLPTQWRQIGESYEGRALQAATFGDGRTRVYLIGGIHGDELPGLENIERVRALLKTAGFLGDVTVRVLRDANPDGTLNGTRLNARGVDLNRNFPAESFTPSRRRGPAALSEPEARTLLADLKAFRPDLVVAFHAARRGPFVNYDGPARHAAERFARAAAELDSRWYVEPDMGYPTPGSLGSLVGDDWGVPILTIEFLRGQPADEAWPVLEHALTALVGRPTPELLAR
jgi:protein MpaA